jgi:hypothetical protein
MDDFFLSAAVLILSLDHGRSISFPMLGLPDDSSAVAINGSALMRLANSDASADGTGLNTNANFISNYGCRDRTREQCSKQVPAHPILLQLSGAWRMLVTGISFLGNLASKLLILHTVDEPAMCLNLRRPLLMIP